MFTDMAAKTDPTAKWVSVIPTQLLRDLAHNRSCSEPISYLINLNLNFLSNFSIFDKNNKSLDSCDTVTLSTDFRNFYVIFLTYFYWFWACRSSKVSTASTAVTSTVTHQVES